MAIPFNFTQILPELYIGSGPHTIRDIDYLKRESAISAVLNLQTDEDIIWYKFNWSALEHHYHTSNIKLARLPIRDFDPDALTDKLAEATTIIDHTIRAGHRIYIHCVAGINRAPTVTIAYLYQYRGYDLNAAIDLVCERRTCDPYVEILREYKFAK